MKDTKALIQGQKVLFLTTVDMTPTDIKGQNTDVLPEFASLGAEVSFVNFRDLSLPAGPEILSRCNVVILWTCDKYNFYFQEFTQFLRDILLPFQREHPEVRIVNGADIILWNAEKSYLAELEAAGFPISSTVFVDRAKHTLESLEGVLQTRDPKPLVVKPSVSASGNLTHCVKSPALLSSEDEAFLEKILAEPAYIGSIMLQEYEETITKGEYSLVYIGGELILIALKKPMSGDFRINRVYGGSFFLVEEHDLPLSAIETGRRLWPYLDQKFSRQGSRRNLVYLRVDGVVRDDGQFILGEAELVEPEMLMSMKEGAGFKAFCSATFVSPDRI